MKHQKVFQQLSKSKNNNPAIIVKVGVLAVTSHSIEYKSSF